MPNPVLAIAGASAGSSILGARAQSRAASDAAGAQVAAAQLGVDEQRRQFDRVQQLLRPFVNVGTDAFRRAARLSGAMGPEAEQRAIRQVRRSPQFQVARRVGEESILANAAATGGLRGGDTQAALAEFAPQLLNQTIAQRYSQLGGLGQVGQASAAGVGSAAQMTGQNIANLQAQMGAAQAGGALGRGQAMQSAIGGIGQSLGTVFGSAGTSIPEGESLFGSWGF